uniref:Uncharacterized protein n=1 Tax=Oryza brachyantha TaxID=4533 RepID=J3L493_ORYBR
RRGRGRGWRRAAGADALGLPRPLLPDEGHRAGVPDGAGAEVGLVVRQRVGVAHRAKRRAQVDPLAPLRHQNRSARIARSHKLHKTVRRKRRLASAAADGERRKEDLRLGVWRRAAATRRRKRKAPRFRCH